MRKFLTVVAFALVVIGFFAGFSNFGIPQIVPAPPPKEEAIDLSQMDMGQFIALGDKIFNGKGTCTLCHNSLGRAPMLDAIGKTGPERLVDERYKGSATTLEEYIHESMADPSAFVVAGFGKSGTNDSESPMPDVTGGSIGLSSTEVAAVIAYLQDAGGAEVTVEIPKDAGDQAAAAEEAVSAEPRAAWTDPADIISELSCDACHMIRGEGGDVGPDLTTIGARSDKAQIRQSILDPNAVITEGFEPDLMPPEMGEQIYASELEVLVNFLADSK